MANEIQVNSYVTIANGNLQYTSSPTSFLADMTGTHGPSPGAVTATTAGVDISFTQITIPGVCVIQNLDATNFVTFGIWDPESGLFYPLGEVQPGEIYVFRLSRQLAQEHGTGAGTAGPSTNTFDVKADTAACEIVVSAFEA